MRAMRLLTVDWSACWERQLTIFSKAICSRNRTVAFVFVCEPASIHTGPHAHGHGPDHPWMCLCRDHETNWGNGDFGK